MQRHLNLVPTIFIKSNNTARKLSALTAYKLTLKN